MKTQTRSPRLRVPSLWLVALAVLLALALPPASRAAPSYGEHTMHDFKIVLLNPGGEVQRAMVAFDEPLTLLLPSP